MEGESRQEAAEGHMTRPQAARDPRDRNSQGPHASSTTFSTTSALKALSMMHHVGSWLRLEEVRNLSFGVLSGCIWIVFGCGRELSR